jgi:chorismate mutase/prephenate dehydratase
MTTAVYQGVDGAYSQLVLEHFLRERGIDAQTVGVPSYREVATRVAGVRAAFGVMPVENAIVGTVREAYDLLAEFDVSPVAEIVWRTDHRLLGVPGTTLRDVREILGHPLVLAECGKFLSSLTQARAIPCEDTGVAAREVARGGSTAVAALAPSAAASLYGLIELANHCADHRQTYSRFMVFMNPHAAVAARLVPSQSRKTSLIFAVDDTPGRLALALTRLAQRGINVTKLESKPWLGHRNEQVFYADIEGDLAATEVSAAIDEMRECTRTLTLIGSYDAHEGAAIGTNDTSVTRVATPKAIGESQAVKIPVLETEFPRVARASRPDGTVLQIGNVRIGDGEFTIIAGPCSVESREQVMETAQAVHARGAVMLRGGAFKPRTSPYAFQGLGWEGVSLLAEAGRATGMPTVSEVMTVDQVDRMAAQIDVLQIGARNMQNFDLLKAVGRSGRPVLLKRGLSATIDELLAAAEYVLAEGNPNVMLCERGIRTFERATRNTLDLSAVPVLRERTHLPIFVDPSHAVGVRRWIRPLARAAKAVGAHGLLIEVHPNPPEAKSDKEQALTFGDFSEIVDDLSRISVWSNPEALI